MSNVPADIPLDLRRMEDLFLAPAVNPFSAYEAEILGQCGMDLLRKRYTRRWLPRSMGRGVVLRLPAAASAGSQDAVAEQAAITRAAILRYCTERMAANQDARRLAMAAARRELLIAAVVTAVAILMLTWFAFRQPEGLWSYVLALATIFAVFAASLTIWDALESWFFDWTPFAVDNAAYRWISHLQVRIAPATAEDTQKEPAT